MSPIRRTSILRGLFNRIFRRLEAYQVKRITNEHVKEIEEKIRTGKMSKEDWKRVRGQKAEYIRGYARVLVKEEDEKRLEWERRQPTVSVALCRSASGDTQNPVREKLIVAFRPTFANGSLHGYPTGLADFAVSIEDSLLCEEQGFSVEQCKLHLEIQRGCDRWEGSNLHIYEYETEDAARRCGSGKTALAAKFRLAPTLYNHLVEVIQPVATTPKSWNAEQDILMVFSTPCEPFEFPVERDVVPDRPVPNAFHKKLQLAEMNVVVAVEEARVEEVASLVEPGPAFKFARPGYDDQRKYFEIGQWVITETHTARA